MLQIKAKYDRFKIFLKKSEEFSPQESAQFRFFQFNAGNAKYFLEHTKKLDVRIAQLPHFSVAQQVLSKDRQEIEEAKSHYLDYLKSSWPALGLEVSPSRLEANYDRFVNLAEKIRKEGQTGGVVVLTRIPGLEGYFVVDGNHRCSITSALGLPVSAKILEFPLVFDRFMRVDEFYGTNNKGMPYQSIYLNKSIIRQGRRNDIYDRIALLPPELICEKSVLDVGCNLGMNAIGVLKSGAKKVVGLEVSQRIVNHATRFAVLDQSYPDVEFRQFNVDTDRLSDDEQFDVAFMLSVHNHLKNPDALIEIARNSVSRAVIFEGHPDTDLEEYRKFLDASNFSRIEKVADLATSAFNSKQSRSLWIFFK